MNPQIGDKILIWLNGRATHRTVIRRHGELVVRNQGGFDKLRDYKSKDIGANTTLWKFNHEATGSNPQT